MRVTSVPWLGSRLRNHDFYCRASGRYSLKSGPVLLTEGASGNQEKQRNIGGIPARGKPQRLKSRLASLLPVGHSRRRSEAGPECQRRCSVGEEVAGFPQRGTIQWSPQQPASRDGRDETLRLL